MSARRVMISGAASGIAAATMRELRSRGAEVVGLDLHGSPLGEAAARHRHDADWQLDDRAVRYAPGRIVLSQVRNGPVGQSLDKATGPLGDFIERMTKDSRA